MHPRPCPTGWLRAIGYVLCAACCVGLWADVAAASVSAPTLTTDGDPQAGYVTVSWESTDLAQFQVELSEDPSFSQARPIYEGTHRAKVLSGLEDGTRYFRARGRATAGDAWGPWSESARFEVKHHSLTLALSLMAVGAAVFVATAAFLLRMSGRVDDV